MRSAAAVLILSGSLLLGAVRQRALRTRLACLADLASALRRMEAELAGKNAPLPTVAAMLAGEEGAARRFFSHLSAELSELGERSFRELWCEAAEEELPGLEGAEREALCALGAALGRYPLDMQLAALSRCRNILEERLQRLRGSLPDETRLSWGLCAACGLLLLILLL
jgi:stage III sporulation protein AB